jgi:hypothetical protein
MDPAAELMRAILLAIDAGDTASGETRRLVMGNSDPAELGTVIRRALLGGRLSAVRGPAIGAAQVKRACEALDEFNVSLENVNRHISDPRAQLEIPTTSSARLWDSNKVMPAVHNQVNAVLAVLAQYRVNLILKRPLVPGSAVVAGHESPDRGDSRSD